MVPHELPMNGSMDLISRLYKLVITVTAFSDSMQY